MVKEKRETNLKTKIISTLASAVFLIAPNITQARNYYNSVRNRVRWSPYAFTHKKSGLISGYNEYSPYAFNHKNPSGLVSRNVHYTPYAFTHKTSGLIEEHSHNSLFFSNNFPCYTIFSTCWPIKNQTKNPKENKEKLSRKELLSIQQKSKTPISDYAKAIHKYLSLKEISFTRKGENFILQNEKKIILSPGQNLTDATEKYKTHIEKGYTINLLKVK